MTNTITRSLSLVLRAFAALFVLSLPLMAAPISGEPRDFDVPAAQASEALKRFSTQSGVQFLYSSEEVSGIRTTAVKGSLSPREALNRLLSGTGLVAVEDPGTGAIAIRREAPPPSKEGSKGSPKVSEPEEKLPTLEPVTVLGSRVQYGDEAGPSPVVTYNQDYIRATGALTLSDFLNLLPQNYAGISAGRGSAPNELNPEFGQRTESTTPRYNYVLGSSAAPAGQTGVSGVSLRGLGSGSTLVLVDGRRVTQSGAGNRSTDSQQGFVDLNTIPFGMIERVEISTDGSSAIYGADAVAGVINIVLKKNWSGSELSGSYKGAFDGGGHERLGSFTNGFNHGKLRGTVNVSFYDRAPLKASQRDFSSNQNHTGVIAGYDTTGAPIAGRDLRLNWSYPAVVQARIGTLNGLTDSSGAAVRFAVVKDGTKGTALSDFSPSAAGPQGSASGIVRGNTATYLDLIPESQRHSFASNFTYLFSDNLEAYGSYSFTDTRGKFETQPPVSSAAASSGFGSFATVVPAAYNPFGQDVLVGMVHYEFGSIWQKTHTKAHSATLGVRGRLWQTWQWDTGLSLQRQDSSQLTRNFNGAAVTAALNNSDPAQRLNPFIDARVFGVTQAAIYERMALYPINDSGVKFGTWDFSANGDLFDIWGGPVRLAWGGSWTVSQNDSQAVSYSEAVVPVVTSTNASGRESSYAGYTELAIPVFGKPNAKPLLQRLEFQLASRYESYDRSGGKTVPKVGVSWVPVKSLLLRSSYSEGYRAPALTEYQVASSSSIATLLDPRRTPTTTTGVTINRGSNDNVNPETSTNEFYGLVFEPTWVKGLNLQVNYYRTRQKNVIQQLGAQAIVNNETLFPTRVTRAAPDATDTSLNQPGKLTAVDLTFVNFGEVRNDSIDYSAIYNLPWEQIGRWQLGFTSTHTLQAKRQLAPGQPAVADDGDTYAPPRWKHTASIFWNKGVWSVSSFFSYIGNFKSNAAGNTLAATYPVPAVYKVDLRCGYEFKKGVWRGCLKSLRVNVGVGNLFDKKPPFSDTVFGYNGALHSTYAIGRTYELSFIQPF